MDGPATIGNVTLRDPAVSGTRVVGALVGRLGSGTAVTDSAVVGGTVSATGLQATIGGLAGSSSGRIDGSATAVSVNGSTHSIGEHRVGGLVGWMRGDDAVIENSSATGAVRGMTGSNDIGGLVGTASDGAGLIQNSYATGDVTGASSGDNAGDWLGDCVQF